MIWVTVKAFYSIQWNDWIFQTISGKWFLLESGHHETASQVKPMVYGADEAIQFCADHPYQ